MVAPSLGYGSALGLSINYVTEEVPLDTGGGIRNAARSLRGSGAADPVVVLNCDILSGHDLGVQGDLQIKTDAAVTLHLVEVADPAPFGCVPTDASGRVTAFLEKTPDPVTNRINAGCYVFRRDVIDQIPAGRRVSVERETFPGLIDAGQLVMGYHESAYWLDVGTPQAFVRGSCDLLLGRLPGPGAPGPPRPSLLLRGAAGRDLGTPLAFVRGSCDLVLGRLPGPAVPGPPGPSLLLAGASVAADAAVSGGTVVGAGARVGAGATVDGSVLFDGAIVGDGAVVRDSILGRGAVVAPGAVLDEAVVGDGAFIGAGNELARGIRIWPDVRLEPTSVRFSAGT